MRKLFFFYSLLFGLAAVYHIVGVFIKVNQASPIRHLVFAIITSVLAYLLIKRPRYLPYLFGIFLIQQLNSHGEDLYQVWLRQGQIDWISLGVVLLVPCIFISILLDRQQRFI